MKKVLIKRIFIITEQGARELIKTRFTGRNELVDLEVTRKQVRGFTGAKKVLLEYEERDG
jgi:hypothetical protein